MRTLISCMLFRLGRILRPHASKFSLSSAVLRRFACEFISKHGRQYEKDFGEPPSDEFIIAVVAKRILQHYLGKQWVQAQVFHNPKGESFLHLLRRENEDAFKFQDRLVNLAETLFNLQGVPGIDYWVEAAQGRVDIEAAVAELMGARLLHQGGADFSFVKPSGIPEGANYDAEVRLPDGTVVPCEMKCKIESTPISRGTLEDTLKQARSQFTKLQPGIVFIRVPEKWTKVPGSQELVDSTARGVLRQTSRLLMVTLHWEEWHLLPQGRAMRADKFWPILSERGDPHARELDGLMQSAIHPKHEELSETLRETTQIDSGRFHQDFLVTERWQSLHGILNLC